VTLLLDTGPLVAALNDNDKVDLPRGAVDALVVAIAERLGTKEIATLDRRHFSVVRPRHAEVFSIVP
jgi:predicted nucleic acid-binding protein